jgi:glycine cleavage system H protein
VAEEIRFTKEHEWVIIKEGLAVIGISDFAQRQLGDIVSIELPRVGSRFRYMQAMAIIDSVKASSDIYSALSGEVVEVNEGLLEHPEWINQSPYELGWIVKMKASNIEDNEEEKEEELDRLMTNEQYNKFIGEIEMEDEKKKKKEEVEVGK